MFRSTVIAVALCLAAVTAPVASFGASIAYGVGPYSGDGYSIHGYDAATGSLVSQFGSIANGSGLAVSTVPIPPAAWLFGSALGLMGWMRRKAAA